MHKRSVLVLLVAAVIASVVVGALAFSDTVYTWEKTFEVKKPEIECEIEVSDNKIVGCPVKVWVLLKLENGWKDDCWDNCNDEHDNRWEDKDDYHRDLWKCGCHVNGTYSAHLYWWNETLEDWQHVMHLQEETNITLTCGKYVQTYMFIPEWEGEYKVVVMFAVDSETYNFTSED